MWRCLPFKSKSLEKGKATRKRTELNLKNGDFFPPEGHCSLHLLSENVEDDTGSYRKVLYFGGARRTEESSWKVASSLFEITYFCEADDVTITDIIQCDTIGSRFSCLQSAAACVIQKKVLVWGGLNTERIDTTDELFLLKKTRESGKKYQCTLVQTNVGNESGHVQKEMCQTGVQAIL